MQRHYLLELLSGASACSSSRLLLICSCSFVSWLASFTSTILLKADGGRIQVTLSQLNSRSSFSKGSSSLAKSKPCWAYNEFQIKLLFLNHEINYFDLHAVQLRNSFQSWSIFNKDDYLRGSQLHLILAISNLGVFHSLLSISSSKKVMELKSWFYTKVHCPL